MTENRIIFVLLNEFANLSFLGQVLRPDMPNVQTRSSYPILKTLSLPEPSNCSDDNKSSGQSNQMGAGIAERLRRRSG